MCLTFYLKLCHHQVYNRYKSSVFINEIFFLQNLTTKTENPWSEKTENPWSEKTENPWSVNSIYNFQYFNCPACTYKHSSKQEFVNHAYEFHPEVVDTLNEISDGSLCDVICPWDVKELAR